MPKFLINGQQVEVAQDTIDRMFYAAHPEARSAAANARTATIDAAIGRGTIKLSDRATYERLAQNDPGTFDIVMASLNKAPTPQSAAYAGNTGAAVAGDEGPSNPNAEREWDEKHARIMREETNGDARKAADLLQLREPRLYDERREAMYGMKLPSSIKSTNRHFDIVN